MDLGAPISYLTLAPGTPVFSSDGEEVGRVEHVLADPELDVFDGVVIDVRTGPGGLRFADAPRVAQQFERGVVLTLDARQARALPEPSANPAVMEADPDDAAPDDLRDKLRRAWAVISGDY
jgi:C-terminal processing protease CtpA/Prc